MLEALQVMGIATIIATVTGFLISLLIQVLTRIVRPRPTAPDFDAERIAVAIAVAVRRKNNT